MDAPRITLHLDSNFPARRQIFDQIRGAVVEGVLEHDAELPSVRRLALDLGVHFNTVAEAYRLLAEDGWIEIVHGRRARVVDRAKEPAPNAETATYFRQRLRQLISEMRSRGFTPARIAKELKSLSEGLG